MTKAARLAAVRGFRTTVQALAGVSAAVPVIVTVQDAKLAGTVAMWGAAGAVIAGVTAFLQNFAEGLEDE